MRINEIKKTEYKKGDLNISLESCARYYVAFRVETLDGEEMYLENQYLLNLYKLADGTTTIETNQSGKVETIKVKESFDTVKMLVIEAENEYDTVVHGYSLQPVKDQQMRINRINTMKYKKGDQWITLKSCLKYLVAFKVETEDGAPFYINPEYVVQLYEENDGTTSILVNDPDYTFKLRLKESVETVRVYMREAIQNYRNILLNYSLQPDVKNK